jgi:hypothetical protein
MLLAELVVRHTRRHMPTRRVALESAHLPTTGAAPGVGLLTGLVAEHRERLDDEARALFLRLVDSARDGLRVPSIALRHRLQTDTHGLDRSRHRLLGEDGRLVLELDVHGPPVPQLLGAVLAASVLLPTPRGIALRAVRDAFEGRLEVADGIVIRRLAHGVATLRPPPAGVRVRSEAGDAHGAEWVGVPSERRWAMEVLGVRAHTAVTRTEVNRRYRRLLRDAHPDHGGSRDHAAERIAELSEARRLLLDLAEDFPPARPGDDASAAASDRR